MDHAQKNKEFVLRHFEELVNQKDTSVIARNFVPNFLDHEGPNGEPIGVEEGKARMKALATRFPDLHVEIRDCIAEQDKVVVRGAWTGTDAATGQKMEFHGFVSWRIEDGKFVERWATTIPPAEVNSSLEKW